jgi:hypothetical protein
MEASALCGITVYPMISAADRAEMTQPVNVEAKTAMMMGIEFFIVPYHHESYRRQE